MRTWQVIVRHFAVPRLRSNRTTLLNSPSSTTSWAGTTLSTSLLTLPATSSSTLALVLYLPSPLVVKLRGFGRWPGGNRQLPAPENNNVLAFLQILNWSKKKVFIWPHQLQCYFDQTSSGSDGFFNFGSGSASGNEKIFRFGSGWVLGIFLSNTKSTGYHQVIKSWSSIHRVSPLFSILSNIFILFDLYGFTINNQTCFSFFPGPLPLGKTSIEKKRFLLGIARM